MQLQARVDKKRLDPYDRKTLRREMGLFEEWFCQAFLGMGLSADEQALIANCLTLLEDAALAQATVAVHRDYHSRNLMLVPDRGDHTGPGIIDFQDARNGPYTYDLVSLLRDCYIRWPQAQVEAWGRQYLQRAQAAGIATDVSATQFSRDFDLMGMQRHLKVMGIFSRLCIRDHKSGYLADIPLVIQYFLQVGRRYPELGFFIQWFEDRVLPLAREKLPIIEG